MVQRELHGEVLYMHTVELWYNKYTEPRKVVHTKQSLLYQRTESMTHRVNDTQRIDMITIHLTFKYAMHNG